jgi:hypothetical protein
MLATLIAGVLTAIRDAIIAAALAWVGVTVERVEGNAGSDRPCAAESCQAPAD